MNLPKIIKTALLASVLIGSNRPAQSASDMVTLLGEFVQSNYAASKCLKPDAELLSRYLNNFKLVSQRATAEMQRRNPQQSRQQIYQQFQKGSANVMQAMDEAMKKQGCNEPRIQSLLTLYQTHANLDLTHE